MSPGLPEQIADEPQQPHISAEELRAELSETKRLLLEERRYARLLSESARAVAPEAAVPLIAQIEALERALQLIMMSRAYKIGLRARSVKLAVDRIVGPRSRPAPSARPEVDRREATKEGGDSRLFANVSLASGIGRPVVFFVPWLTHGGGAERFVSDLAGSLVQHRRTVVVVVTNGVPPGMSDATDASLAITPHVFDLTEFDRSAWLSFCKSILEQLRRPVIINVGSTWLYQNLEALRAGEYAVKVVDQLFNHVGHVASNVASGSNIDTTVVTHRGLERLLVQHLRVGSQVITVPPGVPVSPLRSTSRNERDRPLVGWLGRLSSEKRPLWFVELARTLGPGADFHLGGDGPQMSIVRKAATSAPSLHVSGLVLENLRFVEECDLLAITSEVEGISLAAMEAISRGTPVVSTDVGGMVDLIVPGANGYLVSPDDFRELVSCVKGLLENPAELGELQNRTRDSGLPEQFTVRAMVERFREILV